MHGSRSGGFVPLQTDVHRPMGSVNNISNSGGNIQLFCTQPLWSNQCFHFIPPDVLVFFLRPLANTTLSFLSCRDSAWVCSCWITCTACWCVRLLPSSPGKLSGTVGMPSSTLKKVIMPYSYSLASVWAAYCFFVLSKFLWRNCPCGSGGIFTGSQVYCWRTCISS